MQRSNKFPFLVLIMFFMFLFVVYGVFISPSVVSAATFRSFSIKWNRTALGPASISEHALDSLGQVVYFGSGNTFGPYNFLYAVNITNGQMIWNYSTRLPVNYVSHFEYNNSEHIIAGTGGSNTVPSQSYVLAFGSSQNNATLWKSINLNSSVQSLGSAESSVLGTEDVIAGLANGTVVSLSGNNGIIQWRFNENVAGPLSPLPYDIFQLNNGSVVVGTRDFGFPNKGHIYCLEKDGALRWSNTSAIGNPLTLIRKFGDVNNDGVPDVVAVFSDDHIDVLDGATGKPINPWPFNVGDQVTDLLCTQDYTGDKFPDIVVGTRGGGLMIINGRTATPFLGPASIGYIASYVQYMYSYENGVWSSNKTLAVSLENSTYPHAPLIYGIDVSGLAVMGQISVPGGVTARNLFSVGNYTSPYTGDLLFTANNIVYLLSGADIIVSEFPSQIIPVISIVAVLFLVAILQRQRLRID